MKLGAFMFDPPIRFDPGTVGGGAVRWDLVTAHDVDLSVTLNFGKVRGRVASHDVRLANRSWNAHVCPGPATRP